MDEYTPEMVTFYAINSFYGYKPVSINLFMAGSILFPSSSPKASAPQASAYTI
jgi:hypothetical protein